MTIIGRVDVCLLLCIWYTFLSGAFLVSCLMFYLSISVIPLSSDSRMASGAAILFNKCVGSGSGGDDFIQTSYAFFMRFGFE